MKQRISLLLAALLAASVLTACDTTPAETDAQETDAVETDAPETDAVETDAPNSAISTAFVTENGEARAHIAIAEGADSLLAYAAEELAYHIEMVSGATVPMVSDATADSLAIIIGTPDTNPELNELFADDIVWLTTLKDENGKSYGSDGFAIRYHDNALYIFGATPRGALNGVYDFLEENMGILWIRADESTGTIFDEQPTIALSAVDYREKSPFEVRGWNLGGRGGEMLLASDTMMSRNKLNALLIQNAAEIPNVASIGLYPFRLGHNAKSWVLSSPIYDPTVTEYWNNTEDGTPIPLEEWSQINFWSDLTADTVAESMIAHIAQTGLDNVGFGIEDNYVCTQYPESTEPYEYAPGQFVAPGDPLYLSTVYYSFLNKVIQKINAVYPDVVLNTWAYAQVLDAPLCEVDDHISIVIAPILEDMTSPVTDTTNKYNNPVFEIMGAWKEKSDNVLVYNYYLSCCSRIRYERAIWDRIQADLQYYADINYIGLLPEGAADVPTWDTLYMLMHNGEIGLNTQVWDMNALTCWIYHKLSWNPSEDVDALIEYFCDKVYGEASKEMQEYYRLIEYGWQNAEEAPNYLWNYKLSDDSYFEVFVYQMDLETDIIETLRAAYDAADTDIIKERIRPIKESYEAAFPDI